MENDTNCMRMQIRDNLSLPRGTFRIICRNCRNIYCDVTIGDQTAAVRKAMSLFGDSNVCKLCKGEVMIELNPEEPHLKYTAKHPYYPSCD